jgi:hypothetical protein
MTVNLKFEGKKISKKHMGVLWKENFVDKPMSDNIKAYNVSKEEFFRIKHEVTLDKEGVERKEFKEYGSIGNEEGVTAFVLPYEDGYLIFRRIDSCYSKDSDLLHELRHIYNGDAEK